MERSRYRLNRDFALGFVRPHDLMQKVCAYGGDQSGRIRY
jgi:hypothetical protein